jgi:hypothetical protein
LKKSRYRKLSSDLGEWEVWAPELQAMVVVVFVEQMTLAELVDLGELPTLAMLFQHPPQ